MNVLSREHIYIVYVYKENRYGVCQKDKNLPKWKRQPKTTDWCLMNDEEILIPQGRLQLAPKSVCSLLEVIDMNNPTASIEFSVICRIISPNFEFYSAFFIILIHNNTVFQKGHIIFSVYLSILKKISKIKICRLWNYISHFAWFLRVLLKRISLYVPRGKWTKFHSFISGFYYSKILEPTRST